MCKFFEAVKSALVDNITSLNRPFAGELHTRLYEDPFGGVYTPQTMLVSIMGYELLDAIYGNTEYFANQWSKQLAADDLANMLTIAKQWFEENPEGLQELWESLDIA